MLEVRIHYATDLPLVPKGPFPHFTLIFINFLLVILIVHEVEELGGEDAEIWRNPLDVIIGLFPVPPSAFAPPRSRSPLTSL